jgi:hypothetical protein
LCDWVQAAAELLKLIHKGKRPPNPYLPALGKPLRSTRRHTRRF